MKKPLLQVKELTVSAVGNKQKLDIVRNVSFDLYPQETLALVGESGSGKTMTAQSIVRLLGPQVQITHGQILFSGDDLSTKTAKEMQQIRGKEIAFVSQNPLNSLNPLLQVGTQLLNASAKALSPKLEAKTIALQMLELVGFSDCAKRFQAYPHELSGGMRQRLFNCHGAHQSA